jgi:hypothetical protein
MAEPLWQKKTDVKTKKAKQKTTLAETQSAWSLDYDQ